MRRGFQLRVSESMGGDGMFVTEQHIIAGWVVVKKGSNLYLHSDGTSHWGCPECWPTEEHAHAVLVKHREIEVGDAVKQRKKAEESRRNAVSKALAAEVAWEKARDAVRLVSTMMCNSLLNRKHRQEQVIGEIVALAGAAEQAVRDAAWARTHAKQAEDEVR